MIIGSGLDTVGKGGAPSIFTRVLAMASGLACCPVASARSRNSFSSQMMGVELPWPGSLTFHLIFCVALHLVGGWQPVTVPSALGPRQVGHWLALQRLGHKLRSTVAMKRKIRMNRIQARVYLNGFKETVFLKALLSLTSYIKAGGFLSATGIYPAITDYGSAPTFTSQSFHSCQFPVFGWVAIDQHQFPKISQGQ